MTTRPTPPIAPTFPQSPADRAAHRSASHTRPSANLTYCPECGGSFSGPHQCKPKAALPVRLHESGLTRAGRSALRAAEENAAYLERQQQFAADVADEIAAGVSA